MRRIWIVLLTLSGLLHSCEKGSAFDCFKNTGAVISEDREVADFNRILLRHNINLHLRQAGKNKITVKTGSKLIKKIKTTVNGDGQLEIRNNNSCNWVRSYDTPIDVYLDFVKLEAVEYRSTGDIFAAGVPSFDTLRIEVLEGAGRIDFEVNAHVVYCNLTYGTADIVLKGNCDIAYYFAAGFGRIDNRDLSSKFVYVNNKSSNDLFLQATVELGATIENIGNIYYAGNPPAVFLDKIGDGDLIKLEN
ncbi:MAG: DUF2807 domain-containing protein [Bacteroidales bacterium]|nr:DUF2807 domain-containing protein [Bacteroidales bacterium]